MFQLKATIQKVSTLANSCFSILLHTQDISLFTPEELAKVFKMNEKDVWVAFKELEIKEEELEIKDDLDIKKKTPHKRLYDVLLAYQKVKTGSFDKTRELYEKVMNNTSEQYLDKIRELEDK